MQGGEAHHQMPQRVRETLRVYSPARSAAGECASVSHVQDRMRERVRVSESVSMIYYYPVRAMLKAVLISPLSGQNLYSVIKQTE